MTISSILTRINNNQYYLNGNYLVFYDYLGETQYKRCLRVNEDLIADFPDSIDLKITNKCNYGCPYCHEKSIPNGKSFNFNNTIEILKQLPKVPIEIAIGGGNVLDIPDDTIKLINWCNNYGFKTRITINQKDVKKFIVKSSKTSIEEETASSEEISIRDIAHNIGGVGISLDPDLLPSTKLNPFESYKYYILYTDKDRDRDKKIYNILRDKCLVFHIIAGLFPIDKLKLLLNKQNLTSINNLLILGYKQFGRASNTDLPESLPEFEKVIKEFITDCRNDYIYKFNIAFDNLALEQLHLKDFITKDDWDYLYLGKEGDCSMYIDAVEETYARSSTSLNRVSWKNIGLLDYFKSLRNENNN